MNPETFRPTCYTCHRPQSHCYCSSTKKIKTKIRFVILMHPKERRKPIATGRMAHLCLENSEIIEGYDYTKNLRVNTLIQNPNNRCMVLYPARDALNLSELEPSENILHESSKQPVLFIIDGTWSTAKKTMIKSKNLQALPKICFTPNNPSQYQIRKQPKAECTSTLEAIYHLLSSDLDTKKQESPEILMKVFLEMVRKQVIHQSYGLKRRSPST